MNRSLPSRGGRLDLLANMAHGDYPADKDLWPLLNDWERTALEIYTETAALLAER